jgi:hypothetical protein
MYLRAAFWAAAGGSSSRGVQPQVSRFDAKAAPELGAWRRLVAELSDARETVQIQLVRELPVQSNLYREKRLVCTEVGSTTAVP